MTRLEQGTQIIYVPNHAEGDTDHPACQKGFVTTHQTDRDSVLCRYWRDDDIHYLRTRANSERTPIGNIVVADSVPQKVVNAWLVIIDWERLGQYG